MKSPAHPAIHGHSVQLPLPSGRAASRQDERICRWQPGCSDEEWAMNEVTVLGKAGETAGRAVGAGMRATRRGTVAVSRHGATAAYHAGRAATAAARTAAAQRAAAQRAAARAAAERSLPSLPRPNVSLPSVAVPNVSAPAVPDLSSLRRDLAKRIEPRRRRRWPFVVAGLLAVGVGVAVLARRPVAPPPAAAPPTTVPPRPAVAETAAETAVTSGPS